MWEFKGNNTWWFRGPHGRIFATITPTIPVGSFTARVWLEPDGYNEWYEAPSLEDAKLHVEALFALEN